MSTTTSAELIQSLPDFAPNCVDRQQPGVRLDVETYRTVDDLSAGKTFHLRAYVFQPKAKATKPRPVVLMFHGGGWRGGSPVHWFPQALHLASQDFVAISFQYRIEEIHGRAKPPQPNFIARAVEDSRAALVWTRDQLQRLALDPNRIVVTGDSAGGHLALMLGLVKPPGPGPDAVIALYPAVDTAKLNDGPKAPPIEAPEVSPFHLVDPKASTTPLLTPTKIILGAADEHPWTVPSKTLEFGRRMNALRADICEIDLIPEEPGQAEHKFGHAFMSNPAAYPRLMSSLQDYLRGRYQMPSTSGSPIPCLANIGRMAKWEKQFGFANRGGAW